MKTEFDWRDLATNYFGTVLIANEDPLTANTLKSIIREEGYNVIASKTGLEAIGVYKQMHDNIDLTITGYQLPHISGHDLFYMIRDIDNDAKVVMITSDSIDTGISSRLIGDGMVDIIPKPISKDKLCSILESYAKRV